MEVRHKSDIGAGGQLPAAVQLHILSLLPSNDRALSGRLVNPDARDGLTGPEHCTATLAQPLPRYGASWAQEAGQQHVRQLPLRRKLDLLCTAATSGCEVNLEVALALLQPSMCPELLQVYDSMTRLPVRDPGVAAAKAGHPQLLGWLVRHCPGLLHLDQVLEAAARHCNLAGLQAAWEALQGVPAWAEQDRPTLGQSVVDAAAGSATPDAVAKMQWVLEAGGSSSCRLADSTATAAACAGDLDALRWLRERGCSVQGDALQMLGSVSVAVAQWLVDEAGCWIPAASDVSVMAGAFWYELQRRALLGPDATLKLRWFQERGAPPLEGEDHPHWLLCWADAAAWAGQVEVLRHLLLTLGPEQVAKHPWWFQAAMSGSVPVMECLREAGVRFTTLAYETAAPEGHLGVVRWLALEAGVRAKKLVLTGFVDQWPDRTPAHSRDLLEAVQLLVGEAGCNAWARLPEGFVLAFGSRDRFWNILARGDLALAQFVLGQRPGYRPDTANVKAVVLSGNEALLEWIVQRVDRVESLDGAQLYPLAAMSGDRGMLAALLRLGVPWGAEDVVVRAVRTGSCMTAVRWLVEEGAPVGSRKGMEKAMTGRGQRQKLGDEEKAWLRGWVAT